MGELKRQVLGDASGAVGHLVFRIKGKKNIIAQRPVKKENPPVPSDAILARRERFRLTGSVAAVINKTGALSEIWPTPGENLGSRFNEIFKKNFSTIGSIENLGDAQLIPSFGITLMNAAITLTSTTVTVAADQFGSSAFIDSEKEKFLVAEGIVILSTPLNPESPKFLVLPIKSGLQSMDTDTPISITHTFSAGEATAFAAYTNKKVFLTLLTLTAGGVPVHFTEQVKY